MTDMGNDCVTDLSGDTHWRLWTAASGGSWACGQDGSFHPLTSPLLVNIVV